MTDPDDCCVTTDTKSLRVKTQQRGRKYYVTIVGEYNDHVDVFRGDLPLLIELLQQFAPPMKGAQ